MESQPTRGVPPRFGVDHEGERACTQAALGFDRRSRTDQGLSPRRVAGSWPAGRRRFSRLRSLPGGTRFPLCRHSPCARRRERTRMALATIAWTNPDRPLGLGSLLQSGGIVQADSSQPLCVEREHEAAAWILQDALASVRSHGGSRLVRIGPRAWRAHRSKPEAERHRPRCSMLPRPSFGRRGCAVLPRGRPRPANVGD